MMEPQLELLTSGHRHRQPVTPELVVSRNPFAGTFSYINYNYDKIYSSSCVAFLKKMFFFVFLFTP